MKNFYKVAVSTYKGVFNHCTVYYTDGTWRCYNRIPKFVVSFISSEPVRVSGTDDFALIKFWGGRNA